MNFGEIKSFLKGSPLFDNVQAKGPKAHGANTQPNIHKLGSSAAIFQRSQSSPLGFNVLNKVVTDKLQTLDPQGAKPAKNDSLFDFEEVAKNVLSFVEKMVMKAKGGGADDEKLTSMMEQARKGIDEGFAQARTEIGEMGEVNDETDEGIDKSYQLIQAGLSRFEDRLLKPEDLGQLSVSSAELNYSLTKSSSLSIQTNDGDTVTIDFAQALSYQKSQQNASYSTTDENGQSTQVNYSQSSESRFQAVGFSFSVEGELDDDEKAAIGALVKDVSKLADEFFNGDLDKAFEQATQLGFDESELSGFSLQMSRVEKVSVAQAYQQVAQYEAPRGGAAGSVENNQQAEQNIKMLMKPVGSYLKDLVAFLEQANEKLNNGVDLQELVSQSVSKYLEFKGEVDVTASLERFATFNQHLLGTLDASGLSGQGPSLSGIAPGRADEAPGRAGEAASRTGEAPGKPVDERII